ncbi:MAG: gliding motility protein GldL [Muribaculaceae bacterium]|nr:gliding motility protein GldL [Muribaculaceae bacterium]
MIAPGLEVSEEDATSLHDSISKMAAAADQLAQMAELTTATQTYLERIAGIADQMTRLQETTAELNNVSSILLDSYKAITENSATISESSQGYVESMADLNRNIGGLNTIYEIQLKSISSQLESIDRVNRGLKDIRDMYEKSARQSSRYCEETERMTRYMTQLNSVYEKMVTAMTINMYNPMMGQPRREDDFNPFGPRENGNSEHQREEN